MEAQVYKHVCVFVFKRKKNYNMFICICKYIINTYIHMHTYYDILQCMCVLKCTFFHVLVEET